MKTLLEIQNEVSSELYGIPDFDRLVHKFSTDRKLVPLNVTLEVCRRAQLECARETLKLAETNHRLYPQEFDFMNEENIKLIQ